jgi:hypothetical protein
MSQRPVVSKNGIRCAFAQDQLSSNQSPNIAALPRSSRRIAGTRSFRGKLFWPLAVLLVVLTFNSTAAVAQCVNVTLTTQTAVDNFDCTEVTGTLRIDDDGIDPINNLDGLSGLTSVGGSLVISFNDSLTDVDGLSGLTSVETNLFIAFNDLLTDVDGLSGLTSVGESLLIFNNDSLERFCGLFPLLDAGGLSGSYLVGSNDTNPTEQEILDDGPCDLANTVLDLFDEGFINAGQAKAIIKLSDKSLVGLAHALIGFLNAGILTESEAQLLFVIASI